MKRSSIYLSYFIPHPVVRHCPKTTDKYTSHPPAVFIKWTWWNKNIKNIHLFIWKAFGTAFQFEICFPLLRICIHLIMLLLITNWFIFLFAPVAPTDSTFSDVQRMPLSALEHHLFKRKTFLNFSSWLFHECSFSLGHERVQFPLVPCKAYSIIFEVLTLLDIISTFDILGRPRIFVGPLSHFTENRSGVGIS